MIFPANNPPAGAACHIRYCYDTPNETSTQQAVYVCSTYLGPTPLTGIDTDLGILFIHASSSHDDRDGGSDRRKMANEKKEKEHKAKVRKERKTPLCSTSETCQYFY